MIKGMGGQLGATECASNGAQLPPTQVSGNCIFRDQSISEFAKSFVAIGCPLPKNGSWLGSYAGR